MDTENVVYIYNGILFSHERKEILSFGTVWMDLEAIMLSEMSDGENKHCMFSPIHGT